MLSPQYRPIVGGYERAAERLSATLVARGHSVTVITEQRDKIWPAYEVICSVEVLRLWCLYRPKLHTLTSLCSFALFLLLRGRKFDVWHVHQYGKHAVIAIIIGKLISRPVVLKLTSSAAQGIASVSGTDIFKNLKKNILKRVTAVVALTREIEREAYAFGIPLERIYALGNGVDTTIFHHHDFSEKSIFKKMLGVGLHPIVIFVGRLSIEKNPDGLLKVWTKAVTLRSAGWKLVLVGDGPMRAMLEAEVSEGVLEGSVLFAGQQYNIEEWLAIGDIYVISSHNEGLSNTLLEAMASGLPVVATRVSGITEVVDEPGAGLVVDVGDMNAFADALVRLAGDSLLREKMGTIGRDVIGQRYAIESVAARHEELYQNLLAKEAK